MDPRSDYNGNLEHRVIAGPPTAAASTTPSTVLDVDELMAGLALARPVFHSEADFQHAFAWRIQELFPAASVRLEVRPAGMERRTYIDIWAVIEGRPLAIELKYKTRALSTTVGGEEFEILSHGAQDLGRYDFLKDIARLERAREGTPGATGLVLMLSNDSAYWNKALELGALAALADLPGRGRPALIGPEERAWVLSLACQKPAQLGYAQELWTTSLLAAHVRAHALTMGFPALVCFSRGTVSKLLSRAGVRPHTITYYLERRDPEFEAKMAQVLCVYREVQLLSAQGESAESGFCAGLSYDEKPGIQALGSTAPDLPPLPGEHPGWARDHEYVRHGTLSLVAGIDLATGHILATVRERHRSREFVEFLELVDASYPKKTQIRLILDNHSAHISRETRGYLALHPNRFLFVFTPKHAGWLNLIESFFAKMTRGFLRGIRVKSKEELSERILGYLEQLNQDPVIFRWTYKLDELSVA